MPTEVRWFDSTGAYLRTSGRVGSGPNEFLGIMSAVQDSANNLLVWDGRARRLSKLNDKGDFEGIGEKSDSIFSIPGRIVLPNGSLLALRYVEGRSTSDEPVDVSVLNTRSGDKADLGHYGGSAFSTVHVDGRDLSIVNPFSPIFWNAVAKQGIFLGRTDSPSVHIYDFDGELVRTITLGGTARRLSAGDVRNYGNWLAKHARTPADRSMSKRLSQLMPLPDKAPYLGRVTISSRGEIWSQENNPGRGASSTRVFGADGQWLALATLPQDFRITQVGENWMLGIYRGEDDINIVQLYAFKRQ
jgi:hypothetical protein